MTNTMRPNHISTTLLAIGLILSVNTAYGATLKPETLTAWETYVGGVRLRVQSRVGSERTLLISDDIPGQVNKLRSGEVLVSPFDLNGPQRVPLGLIHDWTAAAFIPRATLAEVIGVLGDYARYREIFLNRADERDEVVMELQAKVRALGVEPATSGTVLAGAHRAFLDIKDALTNSDDKAIIAEIERGEDYIKHKYEEAMRDADLSPACRTGIEQCYSSIKIGHDQMRDLKHGLTETAASTMRV